MNDNQPPLFNEQSSVVVEIAYGELFRDAWLLRSRMPLKMAEDRCRIDALHAIVIVGGQCTFRQWIDTWQHIQRWRWYWARFAKTTEERRDWGREYDRCVGVWHRTLAIMGVEGIG